MENKLENNSAEGKEAGRERRRRKRNRRNKTIVITIRRTTIKKQKVESKTVEKCGSDDGKRLQIFPPRCFIVF